MHCLRCGIDNPDGFERCWRCRAPANAPADQSPAAAADESRSSTFGSVSISGPVVRVDRVAGPITVRNTETGETTTYDSPDQLPTEVQAKLAEMRANQPPLGSFQQFVFRDADGAERTYGSIEELPPELRSMVEGAISTEHLSKRVRRTMEKQARYLDDAPGGTRITLSGSGLAWLLVGVGIAVVVMKFLPRLYQP